KEVSIFELRVSATYISSEVSYFESSSSMCRYCRSNGNFDTSQSCFICALPFWVTQCIPAFSSMAKWLKVTDLALGTSSASSKCRLSFLYNIHNQKSAVKLLSSSFRSYNELT